MFIRTTSDGPLDDDIFWIFSDAAGQRLATFPNSAEGCTKLLEALSERLPDFDNQEVIRAMGSTTEDFFVLWRRADRGTTPEVDSATPHP